MIALHPIHPNRFMPLANCIAEWQVDDVVSRYRLHTVDCGELWLKSGRLVPCDPFTSLQKSDNVQLALPPGRYPVVVTVADVSDAQDSSNEREAYLSLVLSDRPSVGWRFLVPLRVDDEDPGLDSHQFIGVTVDAGVVAFVDADAVERLMPDPDELDWYDELFYSGEDDAWGARAEDPDHLRAGCANIALPGAADGENLIFAYSGWGDGSYAVVGTYDAEGELTGVHIDLAILPVAPMPEWD